MPHLKQTIFVASLSMILCSPISYAEQYYQTEIIGIYEKEDAGTSTDKTIGLGVQVYFAPVNTEKKPLAQAAFLDKKSSVSASAVYMNYKTDLQNSSIDSINIGASSIGINYVTKIDSFILGADYSKIDGDTNPDLFTIDGKQVGVTIGKYINDSTAVRVSYTSADTKSLNATSSQVLHLDIDRYELAYNTVQGLGASTYYSLGVGVALIRGDNSNSVKENNNEFKVSGGYYFSRMTSLEVTASFNSGDDVSDEGQALAVDFTHFITPQIALGIVLSKFNANDSNTEDFDSILLGVMARI